MSNEEAKQKWCPMVRCVEIGVVTVAGNVHFEDSSELVRNTKYSRCIGSECAAWRWYDKAKVEHYAALLPDGDARKFFELKHTGAICLLDNPPNASDFPQPEGAGWLAVGIPEPDEEAFDCWRLKFEREIDPERRGCCGLIIGGGA